MSGSSLRPSPNAEALSRSYQIDQVEKYLILLGKDTVEVVEVT